MTREKIEKAADSLVEDLFTNGTGQPARRLVLELFDKTDGGGWCRDAIKRRLTDFALSCCARQAEEDACRCDFIGDTWKSYDMQKYYAAIYLSNAIRANAPKVVDK